MISLDEVVARLPSVHGGLTTWGVSPEMARFLDRHLRPGAVTLETGAGFSTIVILRHAVARHISITPYGDEFETIRTCCAAVGIDARPLEAIVVRSQDYLRSATLPPLDLVLIDGAHAFPIPFLDWYYTAAALKPGGLMLVDDLQLATGAILADFMRADDRWEEVERDHRFAAYRKLVHPIEDERDWLGQAYLVRSSPLAAVRLVRLGPVRRLLRLAWSACTDPARSLGLLRQHFRRRSP